LHVDESIENQNINKFRVILNCKTGYNFIYEINISNIMLLSMRFIIGFIFIVISASCFSQTDTEFWFVAPEVASQNGDHPILLRFTTYNEASSITISQPANTSFKPIHIDVPALSTRTVDLTPFKDVIENKPANKVNPFGIFIKASKPITSYFEVANESNSEIFVLKGKNALGNQFFIPAQNTYPNDPGSEAYNSFDIVAIENNSYIEITPSNDIIGHPGGVTFSINLNKGETYSAVATGKNPENHLMGSYVASAKPLAITVKDDAVLVNGITDLNGDQSVPNLVLGNSYVIVRGNPDPNVDDRVYITSAIDGNRVLIDGDPLSAVYLNSNEAYSVSIPASKPVLFIQSDLGMYIQHQTGYGNESASAIVPSVSCNGSREVAFTRTNESDFTLLIVVQEGKQGYFAIDGNTSLITQSQFSKVPGTWFPAWVYARVSFSAAQLPVGAHIITNNQGNFNLGFISSTLSNQGCGYGYLSDYASVYLGPNITMCPGTTKILDAGQGKGSYLWNTGDTTQKIEIKYPGAYYVLTDDKNGCYAGGFIDIKQINPPGIQIGRPHSVPEGTIVNLSGKVTGTPPPVSYYWTPESSISSGINTLTPTTIPLDTTTTFFLHLIDENGCPFSDSTVVRVINEPEVCDLGHIINNDTTVCAGSSITVKSRQALTYNWSPSNGLSNRVIGDPIITADSTRTYYLKVTDYSNNLVKNSGFELGNTGFTSTHTNCNNSNCLLPLAANGYAIGTDANYFNSNYTGKDHTTGTGNFMVVNGADPSLVVWKQTLQITPNADYVFGTWISTMTGGTNPKSEIRFLINGTQIGSTYAAPDVVNEWKQVFTTWNSGSNTTATLEIMDVLQASNRNEYGLDDIFFGKISSCTDSLKVTVNHKYDPGLASDKMICSGEKYTVGTTDHTSTGLFMDVLRTSSGCDSIIITNLTVIPVERSIQNPIICEGESFTVGNIVYTKTGNYIDTLVAVSGCDSIVISELTVQPLPIVSLGEDQPICPGDTIILSPGTDFSSYLWSDNTILNSLRVTKPGTYSVIAFDKLCSASDYITIEECSSELWFPDAFSPNQDGINDWFRPVVMGTLNTYKIMIYNQWGQLLYESDAAEPGWNGTVMNSPGPNGQYFYIAYYSLGKDPSNIKQRVKRGSFTLLR